MVHRPPKTPEIAVRAWNDFADQYGTDQSLAGLDADQIKAVVDLLLLVMYADDKASVLEEMEFEDQICKLPAIADKRSLIDAHLPGAVSRVRGASADGAKAIAADAAGKLTEPAARKAVFAMAAALAFADIQLAVDESAVLRSIADAFGLDPAEARAIVDANA